MDKNKKLEHYKFISTLTMGAFLSSQILLLSSINLVTKNPVLNLGSPDLFFYSGIIFGVILILNLVLYFLEFFKK